MTIKKFIDRPLLSIVINVMVVAVGIIALTRLPIDFFYAEYSNFGEAKFLVSSLDGANAAILGAAAIRWEIKC